MILGIKNVEADLSNQVVRILGSTSVKTMSEALEQTGRKARLIGQGIPEGCLHKSLLRFYIFIYLFLVGWERGGGGEGVCSEVYWLLYMNTIAWCVIVGFVNHSAGLDM